MRRRITTASIGGLLLFAIGGSFVFSRSGVAMAAYDLPEAVIAARTAGIEPDAGVLVARERRAPRGRERAEYARSLLAFGTHLPAGVETSRLSPAQRAALRPRVSPLGPASLAAMGGIARDWRYGSRLRQPEVSPYRKAVNLLILDARDARTQGDRDGALGALELAERLGHGLAADEDWTSQSVLIGAATRIGRETATLLGRPDLTRAQLERIRRLVGGATFRHPDDRRFLSHNLAIAVADVATIADVPVLTSARSSDPLDRAGAFGKWKPVLHAWQDSLVRPYAEAGRALPRDWTDFDRYRAAYAILDRPRYAAPGFERHYARAQLVGNLRFADYQLGREGMRRTLDYAVRSRLGENPPIPRDPCGTGVLVARANHESMTVYTRFVDRRDEGGFPLNRGKGDFAVTFPLPSMSRTIPPYGP